MNVKTIPERLYDFPAGSFCGVLMPEKVMKKISKLYTKYNNEIKRVLIDNKDCLYPQHWTMATDENKKQDAVYIKFVLDQEDSFNSVDHRIGLFVPLRCEYIKDVYLVQNYDQAQEIANQLMVDAGGIPASEEDS